MEAINARLRQLEDIETALYLQQRTTVQSRTQEDEKVRIKREEEDRNFLRVLKERDDEEDVSMPSLSIGMQSSKERSTGSA
jgi:hypothetical protein